MSHFSMTSIASLSSVWKDFKFTALKELLPSVFPRFKQGWSALICIREDYRFQLFVSYSFSVLCVCLGQHIQVPQNRGLEGTSWVRIQSLVSVLLGSPQGCRRACWALRQLLPLPSQKESCGKTDRSPLCHRSLWLAPCLGQMVGRLPFPAKANILSGALAPLSCAKRRDKSEMQTC